MWYPQTPWDKSTGPLPLNSPERIIGSPPPWYPEGFLVDDSGDYLIDDSEYLLDES